MQYKNAVVCKPTFYDKINFSKIRIVRKSTYFVTFRFCMPKYALTVFYERLFTHGQ